MASVRVEGFPAPDAKTTMEAMEDDESEWTSADLSEDERQDQEIALVFDQLKRLMVRRKMTSREFPTDCSPPGTHITSTNFSLSSSSMASIIILASGAGKPSTLTLATSYGFSSVDPALAAVDFLFSPREVLTSAFFFILK